MKKEERRRENEEARVLGERSPERAFWVDLTAEQQAFIVERVGTETDVEAARLVSRSKWANDLRGLSINKVKTWKRRPTFARVYLWYCEGRKDEAGLDIGVLEDGTEYIRRLAMQALQDIINCPYPTKSELAKADVCWRIVNDRGERTPKPVVGGRNGGGPRARDMSGRLSVDEITEQAIQEAARKRDEGQVSDAKAEEAAPAEVEVANRES